FNAKDVAGHSALHAKTVEHGRDDLHVLGPGARHIHASAGHSRDDRPAPRFDVIAPQPARGPTEPCAALDAKSRRPGAGDADADLLQELAQLDDVRLARSVS